MTVFGASDERIPLTNRCPVLVPGDSGRAEPGWTVIAIGEAGVDVCQTRTGRLRGMSWDELYTYNPGFNIDAVLADEAPPAEAEAPTAVAPPAPTMATPAPTDVPAIPAAPAPPPAPEPPPAPAYRLTPGRPLAVPDAQGLAPGRWEVAAVGDDGVTAMHADGETVCQLTWAQVLLANPDFLPPGSRVRMADGRLGLLIAYSGDQVTIEGAASYQDASMGLRSQAFVGQQFMEGIAGFSDRNADRIG